jgi:hypothetical protein
MGPAGRTARVPARELRALRWFGAFAVSALPSLVSQTANGVSAGATQTAMAWQRHVARSHGVLASLNRPDTSGLPAAPVDVTDLAFAEFFAPIGDRGLEYSAKLRALDGQRVRLVGYMIREPERARGLFRVAASPLNVDPTGACAPDQVPPSAVHVIESSSALRLMPYRPGRLVLVGRIEIGPRVEADGRNSIVRLIVEHAP